MAYEEASAGDDQGQRAHQACGVLSSLAWGRAERAGGALVAAAVRAAAQSGPAAVEAAAAGATRAVLTMLAFGPQPLEPETIDQERGMLEPVRRHGVVPVREQRGQTAEPEVWYEAESTKEEAGAQAADSGPAWPPGLPIPFSKPGCSTTTAATTPSTAPSATTRRNQRRREAQRLRRREQQPTHHSESGSLTHDDKTSELDAPPITSDDGSKSKEAVQPQQELGNAAILSSAASSSQWSSEAASRLELLHEEASLALPSGANGEKTCVVEATAAPPADGNSCSTQSGVADFDQCDDSKLICKNLIWAPMCKFGKCKLCRLDGQLNRFAVRSVQGFASVICDACVVKLEWVDKNLATGSVVEVLANMGMLAT